MRTKRALLVWLMVVPVLAGVAVAAGDEGSWTGEVIDMTCYQKNGARGQEHAACAKRCVKSGQPMGLLTDDGTLVLLAADAEDEQPYKALQDLAGERAAVTGKLAEKDGMKVVTVTGSKAAS